MSRTIIKVFEHERLELSKSFNKFHYNLLIAFGEKHGYKYFNIGRNCIKFTSYVGVIQIDNLTIEILPKVNKSDYCDCRKLLITMLKKSGLVSIKHDDNANQNLKNNTLFELFFKEFIKEAECLIYQGLNKKYRRELKNRKALKGKLVFSEHIKRNFIHKERFFTASESYDRDNIYNQIIKKALEIICCITVSNKIKSDASNLLLNLEDISRINIGKNDFKVLTYDRHTERYRKCIELAKLVILQMMPDLSGGKNSVIALLFNMNALFELFITKELQRALIDYNVLAQKPQKYLLVQKDKCKQSFLMKPDITIKKDGKIIAILDTKWKLLNSEDKKRGVSQSDLYQLYTYSNEYRCRNVALIYPKWQENQLDVENFNFCTCDNSISVISVPLDDLMNNVGLNEFIKKQISPIFDE